MTPRNYRSARLGTWLRAQRQARGWNVPEMGRRLRKAAASGGDTLPANGILESHIRRWERGVVAPSERYKLHYCGAFGIRAGQYGRVPPAPPGHNGHSAPAADAAAPHQPAAPAARRAPCLGCLARMIVDAIKGTLSSCECAAPAVPAARPQADADTAGSRAEDIPDHLIVAAWRRGADIAAIAKVCGRTQPEVRSILTEAESRTRT